jgi:hypothetical protein
MAEAKKSFPMLPIAHWWSLRRKFKQSLPGVVTGKYLATVLNMVEKSANVNVLPYLTTASVFNDLWRHSLNNACSRPTIREIALFESGAPRKSGQSAPRMRRPFAPLR